MGLTTQRARHASAALWAAGTSLGTVLLCASQLQTAPWGLNDVPPPGDNQPPPQQTLYLTVVATCQCQRIMAGCMRRGLTRQTVGDFLQFVLLPAAYIARWPDLGFSIVLVLNIAQVVSELARMGLSLRKGRHDGTFTFFILYCFVWCLVYLVSLPAWVVNVATTPMESQQHRIGLALLFLSLSGHILINCMFSPLVPAVRGYIRGVPACEWLQTALFPGTDQTMLEIRKIAKGKRDSMEANNLARKNSFKLMPEPKQPSKNSDAKALMQTVRCVTVLKRKIKAMRKKKAEQAETETAHKDKTE